MKAFLTALIVALWIFAFAVPRASIKLFWADESNAIYQTCPGSFSEMIKFGAYSQSSPNPFYYFLEKPLATSVKGVGENLMLQYRWIAIFSAVLTALFLCYQIGNWLGLYVSLLGITSLIGREIFQQFGAENRPYMLWVLLFYLFTYFASRFTAEGPARFSAKRIGLLSLVGLPLVMVSSSSFLQLGAGFFGVITFWLWNQSWTQLAPWKRKTFIVTGIVLFVIGYYYAVLTAKLIAPGGHFINVGAYDLKETHNYRHIASVLSLLISRDGFHDWILNLFFLAGLTFPFLKHPRFSQIKAEQKIKIQSLAWHLWLQIAVSVVIGGLVYHYHYHFVQRVFIQLIIIRALAIVIGGIYFAELLKNFLSQRQSLSYFRPIAGVFIVILGISDYTYQHKSLTIFKESYRLTRQRAQELRPCLDFEGVVKLMIPAGGSEHQFLNMSVELGYDIARCGRKSDQGETYILASGVFEPDPIGNFKREHVLFQKSPVPLLGPAYQPVTQCGWKVVSRP